MPRAYDTLTHHLCKAIKGGNCRKKYTDCGRVYCEVHQVICFNPKHAPFRHDNYQECEACIAVVEAEVKREEEQRKGRETEEQAKRDKLNGRPEKEAKEKKPKTNFKQRR